MRPSHATRPCPSSRTADGTAGALVASLSHGLVVAALFVLAAALARRLGSFDVGSGGLAARAPVLTSLFVIAILAAIGVPGTGGAPGEILILAAAFARSAGVGLLAAVTVVISAVYGAGLVRSIFFGPASERGTDLGWRERALVIPLLLLVIALGVAPSFVTDLVDRGTAALTDGR